jgi:hypothetical protein
MDSIPYTPLRMEYNIPVFSSEDISKYGEPDHYGIWQYIVIETDPRPLVYYTCTDKKILPFHQYNRNERFKSILNFLLGNGKVPFEVYEKVMDEITFANDKEMWRDIAAILSKTGNWRYVNRIPTIASMLGYEQFFVTRRKEFILEKFAKASARFDYLKDRNELGERKYFPNMRYVALRLLSEHDVILPVTNLRYFPNNLKLRPSLISQ